MAIEVNSDTPSVRFSVFQFEPSIEPSSFSDPTESPLLVRSAVHASLWAGMAVVYAAVAHRMIPFFSSSALPRYEVVRPDWTLRVLVGG